MVTFSPYPLDPRPRRAADALFKEGMSVDLICLAYGEAPKRETINGINVLKISIERRRGGALSYFYQYAAFIGITTAILALRSLRRRYDLVYVHNMPDILVLCSLIPKILGAKVILDLHDPMPELMTTIFNLNKDSLSVRLIRRLEKWSIARANAVLTVNLACKKIFASRSCPPEKIEVVMNSPDEEIFRFRTPRSHASTDQPRDKRFVIMYHGSLVERNGVDLAIDALARIREVVPAAELRIYGPSTPFLERMMESVRKQRLDHAVHYFGPKRLDELAVAIEDCDVGVIPNHRNAFTEINTPTRIFEYLALGKPVIAPRTQGIQDYFGRDDLLFFDPGNAEDLTQKLEYVSSHYNEAVEAAERGQQVYLAHTWRQERQALVNVASKLLKGGKPR